MKAQLEQLAATVLNVCTTESSKENVS